MFMTGVLCTVCGAQVYLELSNGILDNVKRMQNRDFPDYSDGYLITFRLPRVFVKGLK